MKVYLSGNGWFDRLRLITAQNAENINLLQSFVYVQGEKTVLEIIPKLNGFILDSGAFTFMNSQAGKTIDWEYYVDRYSDFINAYNVDLFFELDIYKIIGYENTVKLRKRIEARTGKQVIPVWHRYLGKDIFIDFCKEYGYVALGGIAIKEIKRQEHKHFPWFIETAHKHNAKIHGLGYTDLNGLKKYHFDSVDSTAWLMASVLAGEIYKFSGNGFERLKKPKGMRNNAHVILANNFTEWVKYSQYAETHL